MRPLLALAVTLCASPALAVQADWLRDGIELRAKEALTGRGWLFEDDGRVLSPESAAPVEKELLDRAVLDLRMDARRAAIEAVGLMLGSGEPLSERDKARIKSMSADLPPGLLALALDPRSDAAKVRAMADADLARVAAHFDGGRAGAAAPVLVPAPRRLPPSPYRAAADEAVSAALRASAAAEIGRVPYGRLALSRLDGSLPPILVEDQAGSVAAHYDIRRKAVVLDRESVLSAVVGTAAPREAAALRASLSTRAALMSRLSSDPRAAAAVAKAHDVVLVHELTHAWQDRRDPIFRQMAHGNIPDTQPLEYEEEAAIAKNLYLHSKAAVDPRSVALDHEFEDYNQMLRDPRTWRSEVTRILNEASPSRALPLKSVREIQEARLARAKALDVAPLDRGRRELRALEAAHARRMAAAAEELQRVSDGRFRSLAVFYLGRSRSASGIERAALLETAARFAESSGDATLIADVRRARERR